MLGEHVATQLELARWEIPGIVHWTDRPMFRRAKAHFTLEAGHVDRVMPVAVRFSNEFEPAFVIN